MKKANVLFYYHTNAMVTVEVDNNATEEQIIDAAYHKAEGNPDVVIQIMDGLVEDSAPDVEIVRDENGLRELTCLDELFDMQPGEDATFHGYEFHVCVFEDEDNIYPNTIGEIAVYYQGDYLCSILDHDDARNFELRYC